MSFKKKSPLKLFICLTTLLVSTESCYHYRVLTTNNDPATEYQQKTMRTYFWGLVNNPKQLIVPNCNNNNSLDEVMYSTNFGQSFITFITLGVYSPIQVKWKCHKPCIRVGEGL